MTETPSLTLVDESPTLGTVELCRLTGASYRQIDYWCRVGHVDSPPARGSGTQRRFSPGAVVQALVLARVAELVHDLPVAARVGRLARARYEGHDVAGRLIVAYGDGDAIVVGQRELAAALEAEPLALVLRIADLIVPAVEALAEVAA